MSQAAQVIQQAPQGAVVPSAYSQFVKTCEYDESMISGPLGEQVMMVGGEEVPIMDILFNVVLVQAGSVTNKKELQKMINKFVIYGTGSDMDGPDSFVDDKLFLMPATIVGYSFRNYDGVYGEPGARLACWSSDGLKPSYRVTSPFGDVCGKMVDGNLRPVCPQAQWDGNNKPKCSMHVKLGFIDVERKIPLVMSLHGTGISAANALRRSYNTIRNVAKLKKKSINDYVIEATVEIKGAYSLPVFKMVEADPELRVRDLIPLRNYYIANLFTRKPKDDAVVEDAAPKQSLAETASAEDVQAANDASGFDL